MPHRLRPSIFREGRQARVSKRMDTLISNLRMSASHSSMSMRLNVPERASRPDRAAALRRIHGAAEYDK
nr:hypothetical protein [Rhizobium bangladeshense]